jgi:hypothetical protein
MKAALVCVLLGLLLVGTAHAQDNSVEAVDTTDQSVEESLAETTTEGAEEEEAFVETEALTNSGDDEAGGSGGDDGGSGGKPQLTTLLARS